MTTVSAHELESFLEEVNKTRQVMPKVLREWQLLKNIGAVMQCEDTTAGNITSMFLYGEEWNTKLLYFEATDEFVDVFSLWNNRSFPIVNVDACLGQPWFLSMTRSTWNGKVTNSWVEALLDIVPEVRPFLLKDVDVYERGTLGEWNFTDVFRSVALASVLRGEKMMKDYLYELDYAYILLKASRFVTRTVWAPYFEKEVLL